MHYLLLYNSREAKRHVRIPRKIDLRSPELRKGTLGPDKCRQLTYCYTGTDLFVVKSLGRSDYLAVSQQYLDKDQGT